MGITIVQVAEQAGVSPITASRVFSRPSLVAEETQQRVLQVARALGYVPNRFARGLRNGKTQTIAVLTADTHQAVSVLKLKALHREIARRGYHLHLLNQQQIEEEGSSLMAACSGAIEGLVLMYVQGGRTLEDVRALSEDGVPVVSLEHVQKMEIDVVTADREAGAYQATCHLLNLGHAPVALAMISGDTEVSRRRTAGYRKAVKEAGQQPLIVTTPPSTDFLFGQGYKLMERTLNVRPRPSAVLFPDDDMAVGALRYLRDEGVVVPQQMAVIGWDNLPLCNYVDPRLSSLTAPVEETVTLAMERLFARLQGERSQPTLQLVQPKLVVRDSCGANGRAAKARR